MKKYMISIIVFMLNWMAFYLIWSFYFTSLDSTKWDSDGRFGYLLISLVISIFLFIVTVPLKSNNKTE